MSPDRSFRASRLAGTGEAASWSIAVFAHNEARRIGAAIKSIVTAAGDHPIEIVVLANGCADRTADRVRDRAAGLPASVGLVLIEIDRADKAHAWNLYVHDIRSLDEARPIAIHFFMDGDVRLEPKALPLLASAFEAAPGAQAVGGMPATGRDRVSWRERMVRHGSLAGNLYALRSSFVDAIRHRVIRMPVGLIGEDQFVSWLVANRLGVGPSPDHEPQCVFHVGAEFSFDSLSPWRLRDYRTYLRRKWRYAQRGVQNEMLFPMILQSGLSAMPAHIDIVYREGPIPSRLRWLGRETPWRTLTVQWVRSLRALSSARPSGQSRAR